MATAMIDASVAPLMIDATVAPSNDLRHRRPSPLIDRSVAPLQ